MFHPLETFPVVDLLGFMDGLTEGDRASVLGDPQLLRFLLRFHQSGFSIR